MQADANFSKRIMTLFLESDSSVSLENVLELSGPLDRIICKCHTVEGGNLNTLEGVCYGSRIAFQFAPYASLIRGQSFLLGLSKEIVQAAVGQGKKFQHIWPRLPSQEWLSFMSVMSTIYTWNLCSILLVTVT